jgi:hypothetical protein
MVHVPNRRHLGRGIVQCRNRHPDSEELPSFAPEAMPIIRALTPHSAHAISLSGPAYAAVHVPMPEHRVHRPGAGR